MADAIVTVHGLWMNGLVMTLLSKRLQRTLGKPCHRFSYRSMTESLEHNTRRLRDYIVALDVASVDVVGHSLGGVLTLHMLRRFPDVPVRRIVCLGSPLVDSRPARTLRRYSLTRSIVGRTLNEGVIDDPLVAWGGTQKVGVIAGTFPLGIGMLVARLESPHDGVVASCETQLPGIAEHVEMPVDHMGMLMSAPVAERVAGFLRDGRFAAA